MISVRKKFLISGRVQGVGFRQFTRRKAAGFGLKGWVRNLQDGRVEGVVEGESETIEMFIDQLRKGPVRAKVTGMEIQDLKQSEGSEGSGALGSSGYGEGEDRFQVIR